MIPEYGLDAKFGNEMITNMMGRNYNLPTVDVSVTDQRMARAQALQAYDLKMKEYGVSIRGMDLRQLERFNQNFGQLIEIGEDPKKAARASKLFNEGKIDQGMKHLSPSKRAAQMDALTDLYRAQAEKARAGVMAGQPGSLQQRWIGSQEIMDPKQRADIMNRVFAEDGAIREGQQSQFSLLQQHEAASGNYVFRPNEGFWTMITGRDPEKPFLSQNKMFDIYSKATTRNDDESAEILEAMGFWLDPETGSMAGQPNHVDKDFLDGIAFDMMQYNNALANVPQSELQKLEEKHGAETGYQWSTQGLGLDSDPDRMSDEDVAKSVVRGGKTVGKLAALPVTLPRRIGKEGVKKLYERRRVPEFIIDEIRRELR
jgi:hypothetical protein